MESGDPDYEKVCASMAINCFYIINCLQSLIIYNVYMLNLFVYVCTLFNLSSFHSTFQAEAP